jgi:GNAT superfamily N-acetyltransferase
MVRPYHEDDAAVAEALLQAAWPGDADLREISAIHGPDMEDDGRWRRTLVYESSGQVLGVGTSLGSPRHPSRYFVVVLVAPEARRRRVGNAVLEALVGLGDGRPLLARVRETDAAGLSFLRAQGFGLLMRSRVGVVDPRDPGAAQWITAAPSLPVEGGLEREELAFAHEEAYAVEHANWSPTTERPLEESLRLFCGESWMPIQRARFAEMAALPQSAGCTGRHLLRPNRSCS